MPRLEIDAQLYFSELSLPLLRELKILEPYGIGNPEPLYMTVNAEVCERKVFSAGIRYRLRQGGRVVSGVVLVPAILSQECPESGSTSPIVYARTNGTAPPAWR